MAVVPAGEPRVVKGRGDYECSASPCLLGRQIEAGEVHVSVHDNAPVLGSSGKPRTDLRHNHFQVRYHCVCFQKSRTSDGRTSFLRYDLEELEGYERHEECIAKLLKEA